MRKGGGIFIFVVHTKKEKKPGNSYKWTSSEKRSDYF
jgi:hypothetical protein